MADIFKRFDSEQLTDTEIKRLRLPTTRTQQFWDILKLQFNNLFKLGLLSLVLILPFLAMIVIVQPVMTSVVSSNFDFLGNSLIGYPGSVDSYVLAQLEMEQTNMIFYMLLVIPITLMGPPIAGLFYTLRNYVWGEHVTVKIDFWRGIKLGWKQYSLICLLAGVILAMDMSTISLYNMKAILNETDFFSVAALVFAIISMILGAAILIYLLPMAAMYNMKLWKLIKNSALLSVGMLPFTVLTLLITVVPFLLAAILGTIGMFITTLMFMVGFVVLFLGYTTYVQYVLDKFVNNKAKNAAYSRGIYKLKEEEIDKDAPAKDRAAEIKMKAKYVNPKKKKKTETEITALPENYSRKDIARLSEEREKLIDEMDGVENTPEENE